MSILVNGLINHHRQLSQKNVEKSTGCGFHFIVTLARTSVNSSISMGLAR